MRQSSIRFHMYCAVGVAGLVAVACDPPAKSASADPSIDYPTELAKVSPNDGLTSAGPAAPAFSLVPVHYATNRNVAAAAKSNGHYGPNRGKLEFGTAMISIPATHRPGEVERPDKFMFVVQRSEDASKHIVIDTLRVQSLADWRRDVRGGVDSSAAGEMLVFVHGYNVSFDDGLRRAAQLGYDLGYEDGVITTFSWPSRATTAAYTADEASIQAAVPSLKTFLTELADSSGAKRIAVIAHSMGNRGVTEVLKQLAGERSSPLFTEVVLAAPDVDQQVFAEQIAPVLDKAARHTTVYASAHDKALYLSQKLHNYERAGSSLSPVDGVDLVDASRVTGDFLGHSYVAGNKQVIDDIFMLVRHSLTPDRRNLRTLPPYRRAYVLP